MTDLLAAGGGLSLALQIPDVVEQAGAIAGFASVIGLAILSALYISQARDLRRLREWAGRAPERAAELAASGQVPPAPVPGRVVATPQRPVQAVKPGTAAAPAAADGATTNGDAAPSVAKEGEQPAEVSAAKQGDGETAEAAPDDAAAKQEEAPKEGEAKQEDDAPAKPGMPAPASAAAAAAGAGAASASAPAAAPGKPAPPGPGSSAAAPAATPGGAPGTPAPAGAPKPGAQPQRPPGSVLPPRTGTMQPVRRPPGAPPARAGASATSVFGPPAQEPTKRRNPLYIALAVVGVLLLGAAAAVGVPALVDGAEDEPKQAASETETTTKRAAPVKPDAITVAVLNGTSIPGLAAQVGDRVDAEGFTLGTVSNASQTQGQRANSVAMYSRGNERDARTVARRLRIDNVQPVDAESQAIAGDASVVVIVGSDKTQ